MKFYSVIESLESGQKIFYISKFKHDLLTADEREKQSIPM